jgi:hypothetical protein
MMMARAKATLISGVIFFGLSLSSIPASATVFVFNQTATTVPGFSVTGSISIDGGIGDLPTINSHQSPPVNFGNLLAFELYAGAVSYGLGAFTPVCGTGSDLDCGDNTPIWDISPGGINFYGFQGSSEFSITGFGAASTVQFGDDNLGAICSHPSEEGICIATGNWDSVPAPASLPLFVTGLGLMGWLVWRKKRKVEVEI